MSQTFLIGTQVWARMPEPLGNMQSPEEGDTEVLSWVVSQERQGGMLYYRCKAPESGGIWTFDDAEVVSGVLSVRPTFTQGARFELGQSVRIKKRVEWQHTSQGDIQKCGRVLAAWCKQVPATGSFLLDYSYWIEIDGAPSAARNWYPQEDLEN